MTDDIGSVELHDRFVKRPATDEEAAEALRIHAWRWNAMNPDSQISDDVWQGKLDEAIAEGYKNEVCSCGNVFLAFHHFTTCRTDGCPFSDGVSLLDRMMGDPNADET